MLHPGERTKVHRNSQHAHVVGVENAVAESIALPESNRLGSAPYDFLENEFVLGAFSISLVILKSLRELGGPQIVQQLRQHLVFESSRRSFSVGFSVSLLKNLKAAKSNEVWRDSQHNSAFLLLLEALVHLVSGNGSFRDNEAGCSGGGDSKSVHGL